MIRNTRLRFVLLLLTCSAILGAGGWVAYSALYDRVLKRSDAWHLTVKEEPQTSPLQLRITVDANQGFLVIREVTTRTNGSDLNVLYHLALSGLAKPGLYWGKAFTITVPNSVTSVSFGPTSETIWRRSR
jgi:hypothetical protein